MSDLTEEGEIEFIREFLQQRGYFSTFECFNKEVKYKYVLKENMNVYYYLYTQFSNEQERSNFAKFIQLSRNKNLKLEKLVEQYNLLLRKYKSIIQIARQCFAIVVEVIQKISQSNNEDLKKDAEYFKLQIGKYYKIISADEWKEKAVVINDAILEEHKKQLIKSISQSENDNILQILLSLKINALQTAPDFRKKWIKILIQKDPFNLASTDKNKIVLNLLSHPQLNIRQATVALLSVIVSSFDGINYICQNGSEIGEKVFEMLKLCQNGQVLQRFCFAFLQKISYNKELVEALVYQHGIIDYMTKWIKSAIQDKVHYFCLEYGAALLSNIIQSVPSQSFLLDNNEPIYKGTVEDIINSIEKCQNFNTIKHLLICLSILNKSSFDAYKVDYNINEKVNEYKENFKNKKMDIESNRNDQKIIIGLCNYVINHCNENEESQLSEIMNAFIKNESESINIECFQDEISSI